MSVTDTNPLGNISSLNWFGGIATFTFTVEVVISHRAASCLTAVSRVLGGEGKHVGHTVIVELIVHPFSADCQLGTSKGNVATYESMFRLSSRIDCAKRGEAWVS